MGQDTKKISREELESVLKRTRSGTRRAVRPEPVIERPQEHGPLEGPAPAGPFDDCSPSSIERVARIEFEIDAASLSTPPPVPATPIAVGRASVPPAEPSSGSSIDALTATPARPLASVIMATVADFGSAIRSVLRRLRASLRMR